MFRNLCRFGFKGIVVGLLVVLLGGCAAPVQQREVLLPDSNVSPGLSNYRLSAGDIVQVTVFQEADMLSEQRIAQDGSINFPLVGRVVIGSQTVEQASATISARLKEGYLINPQVTVGVIEYAPRRFTIFGEVNGSGSFEIPSEERILLPTAVAMAGGRTRIGNLRGVTVTRNHPDGITEYKVNLLTPQGRQFVIEDKDIITVPESLF